MRQDIRILLDCAVLDPVQMDVLETAVRVLRSRMAPDLKNWYAGQFFQIMAEAGRRLEAIENPRLREQARAAGRRLCISFFGGVA